ncbi:MAG: hypothetical protein ACKOX6_17200 [Bdellovibrio sp.]
MKYLLMTILTLLNSFAWAIGDDGIFDRGNGGDVVICTQPDGKKTYQLLDLYERDRGPLLTLEKVPDNLSYTDILEHSISRIGRQVPKIETALRYELEKLNTSVHFAADSQIPEIQDEDSYVLASNCALRQLAVQWGNGSHHGRIYLINAPYFQFLDEYNKAALILHELVYRLVSFHYPDQNLTSRMVRVYVRTFLSEQFDHMGVLFFPGGVLTTLNYLPPNIKRRDPPKSN